MHTVDCKGPDCTNCKQALSEQSSERESQSKNFMTIRQSSEEENQNGIPKTVEPISEEDSRRLMRIVKNDVAEEMVSAILERKKTIEACTGLKAEVHFQIKALIDVLRERELDLCNQIEKHYCEEVLDVDRALTVKCVEMIQKGSVENKKISSGKMLVFDSDFDAMRKCLKRFGQLNNIDAPGYINNHGRFLDMKKHSVLAEFDTVKTENATLFCDNPSVGDSKVVFNKEEYGEVKHKLEQSHLMMRDRQPETISSKIIKRMTSLHNKIKEERRKRGEVMEEIERRFRDKSSENAFETAQKVKMQEEDVKECELSSKSSETASLSSEEVEKDSSLENAFEIAQKVKMQEDDVKECELSSKSFETGSLSSEEVEKDSSLEEDDIEIISRSEAASIPPELLISPPLPPKKLFRLSRKRICFPTLSLLEKKDAKASLSSKNGTKSASFGIGESESDENSMCSTMSSGSNTEKKENPSINEQPGLESSNNCFNASKDEGYYLDPSVALRCSFTKYLKKNSISEWLAPRKSSEQSLPSGNGCISKNIPILVQDSNQHSFESALRPLEPLLPAKKIAQISDQQWQNEWLVSNNCSDAAQYVKKGYIPPVNPYDQLPGLAWYAPVKGMHEDSASWLNRKFV